MSSSRMSKDIHGIGVTLIAHGVMTVREGRDCRKARDHTIDWPIGNVDMPGFGRRFGKVGIDEWTDANGVDPGENSKRVTGEP